MENCFKHSTLSCTRAGFMNYTHGALLHEAVGRTLRDRGIPHHMEDIAPVGGTLYLDITTKPGSFLSHDDHTKGLLIDGTVASPMPVRRLCWMIPYMV